MESHLSNTSAKFYGEITQQMLKNASFPGSNNGTGLFQTIVGLKVRQRAGAAPASAQRSPPMHPPVQDACWPCACILVVGSAPPPNPPTHPPLFLQVREVYERITQKEVVPV